MPGKRLQNRTTVISIHVTIALTAAVLAGCLAAPAATAPASAADTAARVVHVRDVVNGAGLPSGTPLGPTDVLVMGTMVQPVTVLANESRMSVRLDWTSTAPALVSLAYQRPGGHAETGPANSSPATSGAANATFAPAVPGQWLIGAYMTGPAAQLAWNVTAVLTR